LGIDISYSWSDNGGHGEFAHWSYGHGYSWGHNPAYSDASGYYQARSAAASDPNTTSGDYTTYTTEDMRIASYRPEFISPTMPMKYSRLHLCLKSP